MNSAEFSPDGKYRYTLIREWDSALPSVLFVMLNPSTADASTNDPTVTRCQRFAASWGYGRLIVCNLFALRSTDPKVLYTHPDPVGTDNDEAIRAACRQVSLAIAAWGNHGAYRNRWRAVRDILDRVSVVKVLGWNRGNPNVLRTMQPRHPLYVPADTEPLVWRYRRSPYPKVGTDGVV